MKHRLRQFIVYFFAPLITALLAILKVPDFNDKLKLMHPNLLKWLDYFVISGTAFIYYVTLWSPFQLFEKHARKKWTVMEELAGEFNEDFDEKFDFSFNVMLVETGICYHIEPTNVKSWYSWKGRQFSFHGKVLKVVWDHGSNGAPPKFRMTINQGLAGKAFQEGKDTSGPNVQVVVSQLKLMEEHEFKLNDKQKKAIEGVVLTASCPLVIKDKDVDGQKKKIIGVLNVESKSRESAELITEGLEKK